MSTLQQNIQRQIKEIEDRIENDKGNVRDLKEILQRLKMQAFEEDMRESNNRQLLQE